MERASATINNRDWPYLLALGLLGLVLFGYRLGAPGLMDPDEGRYAEIAREMLVGKDWLVPHLNGLPYLEKPPLVYWLTALSFKALGFSEFAARLPSALSALGGVFLAYSLGRACWGPAAGLLGAALLATCAGYVVLGRLLTLDMTFTFFLSLGIGMGYLALSRARRRLWPWAYGALGLAVLTKGPVALVLAGLVWGLGVLLISAPPQASPLQGEGVKGSIRLRLRLLYQPWSWLLLAALTLPWFVLVQWRYPDFWRYFILEQHFYRFLTPAIHPEPFYYYLPVLLGLLLPWSFLLPWSLVTGRRPRDAHRTFLLLWAAAVLGFFSLSQGKLAPYILPALLPLALVMGRSLQGVARAREQFRTFRGLRVSLWVWALVGLGLVGLYFRQPASLARALAQANLASPYLLAAPLLLALTPLVALFRREVGLLVLGAFLLSALIPPGLDRLSVRRSPREAGLALAAHWRPGAVLVGFHRYSQGLSFYSGQLFHLIGCGTELDYGLKLEPRSGLCLAEDSAVAALGKEHPRMFVFLEKRALGYIRGELRGRLEVLASYKDCILLEYERQ